MLHKSFKPAKCKTSLKLAMARIKLMKNKREVQVKQLRREVAQLLETGQDQTARIRVEHVIREEKTMSAYDLIEVYCELIVARLQIIESQKNCPIDLKEAISSLIFASPRSADVPELLDVRKHFSAKYGKEFVTSALELRPGSGVNNMIAEKLSAKAPDIEMKIKVLTAIASEHDIKWEPKSFEEQVKKPLLSGPGSFESASKISTESTMSQTSFQSSQKHESVRKLFGNEEKRTTGSSDSFSTSNTVPTASHPEPPTPEHRREGSEPRKAHYREERTASNRHNWNMDFRDAASAAQAAAESAERASMAARAAAELASRGNDYDQNPSGSHESIYNAHEGGTWISTSSKVKGEPVVQDPIQMENERNSRDGKACRINLGTEKQQGDGTMQDRLSEMTGRTYGDQRSVSSRSSRPVSSSLGTAFDDEEIDMSSERISSEKYAGKQNVEKVMKDDFIGEERAKEGFTRSASSHSSKNSFSGDRSALDHQLDDDYDRRFNYDEEVKNQRYNEGVENADTQRKTNKYSTSIPGEQENNLNDNFETGIFQGSKQGEYRWDSFSTHPHAVYDSLGSDNEDHLELDSYTNDDEQGIFFQRQGNKSSDFSSGMDPWTPKQHRSESLPEGSNRLEDHSTNQPLAAGNAEKITKNALEHDDFIPATFDDAGDSSSGDEEGVDILSHIRGIESSSTQHRNTAFTKIPSVSKAGHESPRFELSDNSDFGSAQVLRMENLTGGLRNKRSLRPPYSRNPLVEGHLASKETATDASPIIQKPDDSFSSLEDSDQRLGNKKPHVRTYISRSRTPVTPSDSDSSKGEDLQPQDAPDGRQYGGGFSLASKSKQISDYTPTVTEKQQTIAGRYNKLNQEPPSQRPFAETSRESDTRDYDDDSGFSTRRGRATAASGKPSVLADSKTSSSSESSKHVSLRKAPVKAYQQSSPRSSIPSLDSDSDEDEGSHPIQPPVSSSVGVSKFSRRTRGTESKFSILSAASQVNAAGTSDAQRKHSNPSTSDLERISNLATRADSLDKTPSTMFLPSKPSKEGPSVPVSKTEDVKLSSGHAARYATPSESKERATSSGLTSQEGSDKKPISNFTPPTSRTWDLASNEAPNPSQTNLPRAVVSEDKQNPKPVASTIENKSKSSSHIHPKLPDYDSLTAHFQSLRANRRR